MILTIGHGASDDIFYILVLLGILVYIAFLVISLVNTSGNRLWLWIVNTVLAIILLPIMIFFLISNSPLIVIPIIYLACLVIHIRAIFKRKRNAKTS